MKLLGCELDAPALGPAYLQHLGQYGDSLPQTDETLAALHGRVRMVLVTNGLRQVQASRLAKATITRYLHAVVISGEEGVAKPQPRVFEVALERAGNPPSDRVLMVGDSLTADIAGGNGVGIDTCWFNPTGLPRDPRYEPVYEIRELPELIALVEAGASESGATSLLMRGRRSTMGDVLLWHGMGARPGCASRSAHQWGRRPRYECRHSRRGAYRH